MTTPSPTIQAKMLRNQVLRARKKNRKSMKGEGFEQMIVGGAESKNQWVFDRRKKCRHCQGGWNEGEVVLVSADMDILIHADCIIALADGITLTSAMQADLEAERLRILQTGEFYER